MAFYADVIDDYDIVFVQEIRDASQTAFPRLCQLLEGYQCAASSRAGRSTSKEQYGVIYRDGIVVEGWTDYNPDPQDRWERPPLEVVFDAHGYTFTAYNIHTKPDDVKTELQYLEATVSNVGDVIVLGDLNADCDYYDAEREPEFDGWVWTVGDDEDTTVSQTNCAYDRIIANSDTSSKVWRSGIYKDGITSGVSDHYLVWVELRTE